MQWIDANRLGRLRPFFAQFVEQPVVLKDLLMLNRRMINAMWKDEAIQKLPHSAMYKQRFIRAVRRLQKKQTEMGMDGAEMQSKMDLVTAAIREWCEEQRACDQYYNIPLSSRVDRRNEDEEDVVDHLEDSETSLDAATMEEEDSSDFDHEETEQITMMHSHSSYMT